MTATLYKSFNLSVFSFHGCEKSIETVCNGCQGLGGGRRRNRMIANEDSFFGERGSSECSGISDNGCTTLGKTLNYTL